jgi:hypothetical protein
LFFSFFAPALIEMGSHLSLLYPCGWAELRDGSLNENAKWREDVFARVMQAEVVVGEFKRY